MAEKQLVSTIKYVAASKPAFFLSEVLLTLINLWRCTSCSTSFTELPALDSWQKKIEGDFEIPDSQAQPYF